MARAGAWRRPRTGSLYLIPWYAYTLAIGRDRLDEALFPAHRSLPENAALISQKVPAELEPGDVLIFHCRTFHAAGRNHTGQAKYSVVFTFRPNDNPPRPGTRSALMPELLLQQV